MFIFFSKAKKRIFFFKIVHFFPKNDFGAQVSLEYLLLLAAFFAAFALVLPIVSYSTSQFLASSDVLLAKRISVDLAEKVSLLQFLGDDSQFEGEYFPAKEIVLYSAGSKVLVAASGKEFVVDTNFVQIIPKASFVRQFKIIVLKRSNIVQVVVQES